MEQRAEVYRGVVRAAEEARNKARQKVKTDGSMSIVSSSSSSSRQDAGGRQLAEEGEGGGGNDESLAELTLNALRKLIDDEGLPVKKNVGGVSCRTKAEIVAEVRRARTDAIRVSGGELASAGA